ncbi:MAG: hypothetical protein HRF46_10805 [Acidobacteriota bacterium]
MVAEPLPACDRRYWVRAGAAGASPAGAEGRGAAAMVEAAAPALTQ